MYRLFVQRARAQRPNLPTAGFVCNHVDVFSWGHSPPEHQQQQGDRSAPGKPTAPFYNAGQRRCTLCDERLEVSFSAHCGFVGHVARVGILERAMAMLHRDGKRGEKRRAAGELDERIKTLVSMWWSRLSEPKQEPSLDFRRIPSLSAATTRHRLWRARFLLQYLRDRGVIRYSLTSVKVCGAGDNTFVRSSRFERSEMIGDNIVKVVVPDRLTRLFPANEGGVTYKLTCIQQLLDSNEGLLEIYDYLGLNSIIGVRLPNNKTKSDVVEALFGELQTFLWANESACGLCQYPAVPTAEHRYVRALVEHLLNELTHMVVMWRIESTLENSKDYLAASVAQGERQKGGQSGGSSGLTTVKDRDYDRSRYAVLPLLLTFPYLSASSSGSAGGKHLSLQHKRSVTTSGVQESGTPKMLFNAPVKMPSVLIQHYNPPLRVVQSITDYRCEVLAVLAEGGMLSSLTRSMTNTGKAVEGKMDARSMGRVKHPQCQLRAPYHELASERYPTWRLDYEEATVRCAVEKRLKNRGAYIHETDWWSLTTTMAEGLIPPSRVETPPLSKQRVEVAEKLLTSTEKSTGYRTMLAIDLCLQALVPTAG